MNIQNDISQGMAYPWQVLFQRPATPLMEGIIDLHNEIFFYLIIVISLVLWIMVRISYINTKFSTEYDLERAFEYFPSYRDEKHGQYTIIEVIWTITPAIILVVIALPSFALLYAMDEVIDPALTIKVIGHQWYWSYEYSDFNTSDDEGVIEFDAYMVAEDDLVNKKNRLLEVDNSVILPIKTHIRVIITSADVLHSWAVPSLGVKVDAVPGRLSQTSVYIKYANEFFGQCSEICGINHGFMPIGIKSVNVDEFISWVGNQEA